MFYVKCTVNSITTADFFYNFLESDMGGFTFLLLFKLLF